MSDEPYRLILLLLLLHQLRGIDCSGGGGDGMGCISVVDAVTVVLFVNSAFAAVAVVAAALPVPVITSNIKTEHVIPPVLV